MTAAAATFAPAIDLSDVQTRLDSWRNALTGLGTSRDKVQYTLPVVSVPKEDQTLEALFNEDDIANKVVTKIPKEALRGGWWLDFEKLEGQQSDKNEKLGMDLVRDLDKRLCAAKKLQEAWIWGRLYGAGAVLLGVDDGRDTSEPLDVNAVRSLRYLTVLRRSQLHPEVWYGDPLAPKYAEPEIFRIVPIAAPRSSIVAANVFVHESRLLMFYGPLTARLRTEQWWNDSVLQRVFATLQQSASSWMSAGHMMTDSSQGVLKIKNLMELIATLGEEALRKRIAMMEMAKSVSRSILIDTEEDYQRVTTSFTATADMLDRFMLRVAAAADMPVTVLFGRSPAGMNATGESDITAWYDAIAAERSECLTPHLETLVRVAMAARDGLTRGRVLDGWQIAFPPLWQPSAKEQAETDKLRADTVASLVNAQVILPEEGAIKLANDGDWPEIDIESRRAALVVEYARLRDPDPEPAVDPAAPPAPAPDDVLSDQSDDGE